MLPAFALRAGPLRGIGKESAILGQNIVQM